MINFLLVALAPLIWGSTYIVTTEFLPPDRPLLAGTLRALAEQFWKLHISGELLVLPNARQRETKESRAL